MHIHKSGYAVVLKMSIFSLTLCLLINSGIHYYFVDYYSAWIETQARVIEIQKTKNTGTSKAGYSMSLQFEILPNPQLRFKQHYLHRTSGLNSDEKWSFFNKTNTNQVVSLWFNRKDEQLEIVQPKEPEFLDNFPVLLGTIGIIFMIISAFIFGEKVQRK